MDKQRTEVHEDIESHIEDLPAEILGVIGVVDWHTKGKAFRTAVRARLHEIAGGAVFNVKTIKEVIITVRDFEGIHEIFKDEDREGRKLVREFMENFVEQLEEKCCGLCLSCFRYGDDHTDPCVGHSHQGWGNLPQHSHPLAPVPRPSISWQGWLQRSWEYAHGRQTDN